MSDIYHVFSKDYIEPTTPKEEKSTIAAELVIQPELYGLAKPRRDVVIIRIAKNEH